MPDVRTYRLADRARVVKVRGDLDSAAVGAVARATGAAAVIDLRDATLVDVYALDSLVDCIDSVFVANRPLRDALDALGLRTESTLAAAFL
jgi:anti-anti-sigma regulatory factor